MIIVKLKQTHCFERISTFLKALMFSHSEEPLHFGAQSFIMPAAQAFWPRCELECQCRSRVCYYLIGSGQLGI